MGRDDYTNSYETYIPGIIFNFGRLNSGFMYQLCHYEKEIKSYVFWNSLDFIFSKFHFNYDIYYKNTEPYYEVIKYEDDLLLTTAKVSYSLIGNFKIIFGGFYINRTTSINTENSTVFIGLSYFFDNDIISFSGGYEQPEAMILRWQGYIEQDYIF